MDEMKQIWDIPSGKRIHVDPEDAWELFRSRVLVPRKRFPAEARRQSNRGNRYPAYKNTDRRRGRSVRLMAYSAAIAAVLMITFLFSYQSAQDSARSEKRRVVKECSV